MGSHALLQGIFPTRDQIGITYISCTGRQVIYQQRRLGSPVLGTVQFGKATPGGPVPRPDQRQPLLGFLKLSSPSFLQWPRVEWPVSSSVLPSLSPAPSLPIRHRLSPLCEPPSEKEISPTGVIAADKEACDYQECTVGTDPLHHRHQTVPKRSRLRCKRS